ncbi:hypothetical protein Ddye_006471, partial [Dipteronia dyeriana]
QLWVMDFVPGAVNPRKSDDEVEKVMQTLQSFPSTVPSRNCSYALNWFCKCFNLIGYVLVNHMMELGFTKSLSEWIGSNLKKSGEHETWAFNLEGAVQINTLNINFCGETSYWPLLEHPPQGMEIAIVRAENSDRWDPDVIQRLESQASEGGDVAESKVSVHILPNSGHWVHVDNPQGLLEIMAPRIASI